MFPRRCACLTPILLALVAPPVATSVFADSIDYRTGYIQYSESCYITDGIGQTFVPQQTLITDASLLVGAASSPHSCTQPLWQDAHLEIRTGTGGAVLWSSERIAWESLPVVATLGTYQIAEVRASSLGLTQPIAATVGNTYSVVIVNRDTCHGGLAARNDRLANPSFGSSVYAGGTPIFRTCSSNWITSPANELAFSVSTTEPTTAGNWIPLPPPPGRSGALGVYDSGGDQLVLFGGAGADQSFLSDVWTLPLSTYESWMYQPCLGTPPAAAACGAFDPVRRRLIVYGSNVYSLDFSSTPTWTQLAPTGMSPGGGGGFSAFYDPLRDRMLFVGATTATSFCPTPEVWQLTLTGTPSWTKLTVAGTPPSGRVGEVVAYDSIRDRILLFGGSSGLCIQPSIYYNDLWSLSLSGTPTWSQVAPSGTAPSGRAYGRAVYDPAQDRLFLLNGQGSGSLWAVAFAGGPAWVSLNPNGSGPSALGVTVILDPVRDQLITFGGYVNSYSSALNTLSLASPVAWQNPQPNGPGATLTQDPKAIYDPVGDRMLVWSGYDVSQLSLTYPARWSYLEVSSRAPTSVREGSVIYDPVRRHMVVFGGYDASNTLQSVAWFMTMPGGPDWSGAPEWGIYTSLAPVARATHSAIYDPNRNAMLVFGGAGGGTYRNDVAVLDLTYGTWSTLSTAGTAPHARTNPAAIYDPVRNRMLVFGGAYWDGAWHVYGDAWSLSLAGGTPTWSQLAPTGSAPRGRFGHTAVYDPAQDRMIVYGGMVDSANFVGDAWELRLSGTPAWLQISPGALPPGQRTQQTAVFDTPRSRMLMLGGIGSPYGYNGSTLNDAWALYYGATTTAVGPSQRVGSGLALRAVPNPARGETRVVYSIPTRMRVDLHVFDINGRRVRTLVAGIREAGELSAAWNGLTDNGTRAGPGVYFLRLKVDTGSSSTRIVLLR